MPDLISITTPVHGSPSRISWGSVIAGTVIAIAVMCCLSELVMALGITFLKPQDPSHDSSIPTIALSGALAWVITALISLLAGGWAAAHLARQTREADSVLHGLVVWGLGNFIMAVVATSAAGMLIGGAFSLVSSGLAAAGSAAGGMAHGTGAALGNAARGQGGMPGMPTFNWDAIKFQAENLLKGQPTAGRPAPAGQPAPGANPANPSAPGAAENPSSAGSDLALLTRLFGTPGATLSDSDRDAAISMLMASTSMSREAAAKQVQEWENAHAEASRRYEAMKAEAEQKARAAAAAAARGLADAAWVAFVATLLGASAAMIGGYIGGHRFSHHPPAEPKQAGQPAMA